MSAADEAAKDAIQLDEVRFREELARLDREWAVQRDEDAQRDGSPSIPSRADSLLGSIMGVCFLVIWTGMAALAAVCAYRMGFPLGIPLALLFSAMSCVGVLYVITGISKALTAHANMQKYQEGLEAYQRRREELIARHAPAAPPEEHIRAP